MVNAFAEWTGMKVRRFVPDIKQVEFNQYYASEAFGEVYRKVGKTLRPLDPVGYADLYTLAGVTPNTPTEPEPEPETPPAGGEEEPEAGGGTP